MKRLFQPLAILLLASASWSAARAQVTPPQLSVTLQPDQQATVAWKDETGTLVLEETGDVSDPNSWTRVLQRPVVSGDGVMLPLTLAGQNRFFRLGLPPLAGILSTSPADGETGVAVTRETVVEFEAPLSAGSVLTTANLYAGIGGRKLLSRVELSGDRTRATLFYLEPLPGNARISVVFDGTGLADGFGRALDADGDGLPGGAFAMGFETLSLAPVAGTAVVGRVFASELVPGPDTGTNAVNKPLAGVTVTVDGMEQTLRAVTDVQGRFVLNNTPSGRFFVHIDGRTVSDAGSGIHYPDKAYYPFVGKAWDAVAGRTNNLAGGTGEIFLPLIQAGTLQPVSTTRDTTITFPPEVLLKNPALQGVSITVPANSLYSESGTRGGKVGIAAVPPDRLPGPLPPGLELPIVITVQTDGGLNFDKPAPICFPNLPDPASGKPLAPGTRQALISFNHDRGIWEAVGRMTVSADGKFICTDPGVGILQPGWHGVSPVPDEPPPCKDLCCLGDDGDDGSGPIGPVRGLGHIGKAGPKPKPKNCKTPPPLTPPCEGWGSEDDCKTTCGIEKGRCNVEELNALRACFEVMLKGMNCGTNFTSSCNYKMMICGEIAAKLQKPQCEKDREKCVKERCSNCPKASWAGGGAAKAGPAEDLIVGEISKRLDLALGLIEPLLFPGSVIPKEVWNQVVQLVAEADSIAGGDARKFMDEYLRELEQVETSGRVVTDDPGNAPPYPVLYAAEILRGNEVMTLRGETEPYGQYSIFKPSDGAVLAVYFYDPRTRRIGIATPRRDPNAPYSMRRFTLTPVDPSLLDYDRDGLQDVVELVYGTDGQNPDSDGDGIPDGAEVEQGTNPLDGVPVNVGIVAAVQTPGPAIDLTAGNNFAAVAEGTAGVSIVNIEDAMSPVLVAHVPVPGNARRVAMTKDFAIVAAGDGGVHVLDIRTPEDARVHQTHSMPGAQAVAADGLIAYVGFSSGEVVALEPATGRVLRRLILAQPVWDLVANGDHLYALSDDRLFAIALRPGPGEFTVAGSAPVPWSVQPNRRLFAGGGIAYTVHSGGYNAFDLANPVQPLLLSTGNTAQAGWRHLVSNGSGLGIAAVGANPNSPGEAVLYDLGDPRKNNVFITQFPTPGDANAVAIFNGMAFVADGASGIQVVNYLPFDQKAKTPTVSLGGRAIVEGAVTLEPVSVTANASDDVQVRNVEFHLDGKLVFSDGSFPFECRFIAPALTAAKTNFTIRARAVDTGGNVAWSEERTIQLLPDTTPPHVVAVSPVGGSKLVSRATAYFSEAMNPATLQPGSLHVVAAGPDGVLDTADDAPVAGGTIQYQAADTSASVEFPAPLPDGFYRAVVAGTVADAGGNPIGGNPSWTFRVADGVFWTRAGGGSWDNGANWSSGTVPGPTDDVYFESLPTDLMTVSGKGQRQLQRLVASQALILTGDGVWEVTGAIECDKPLTLAGATLRGGTVRTRGDGKLAFERNALNVLDGVRVEGNLEVSVSGARANIRNGLVLVGTAVLGDNGGLVFAGNQTLASGTVQFAGLGLLQLQPGTTLTLAPSVVVRGKSGVIGSGDFGQKKLINQGLISADVPGGTLTIAPTAFENTGRVEMKNGGSVNVFDAATLNTGSLVAAGGGALSISGTWKNQGTIEMTDSTLNLGGAFTPADLGTILRSGGTVNLTGVLDLGGATLTLDAATGPWALAGGTLKHGTVVQTPAARLLFPLNSTGVLDGMQVEGDLDMGNPGARAAVRNGLVLNGSVFLGDNAIVTFEGNQEFNTGQVVFNGAGSLQLQPGTTLTLGPSMVIRGRTGFIGGGAFGLRKLVNRGLISADIAGGTLTLSPTVFENQGRVETKGGGSARVFDAATVNTGTLVAGGGGTLSISGAWKNQGTIGLTDSTLNLGGTFTPADLGTIQRNGGTVNLGGILDLAGGTLTLDSTTGSWGMTAGTFLNGMVRQTQGARLVFQGPNSAVTLDGAQVEGDLDLTTFGARAFVRHGLVMNGKVLIGENAGLVFAGDQTFDSCEVHFNGAGGGLLQLEPGTTLTLGPALVIHGRLGTIGGGNFGTRRLVNRGLIAADVAGGKLALLPTEFQNPGILRADGAGAVLTVNVPSFINTGAIEELNGGKVLVNP